MGQAGAALVGRGELSVGQIVSFVAFATLLISKLDQLSGFAVRIDQQAPTITALFELMDEASATGDAPAAKPLGTGDAVRSARDALAGESAGANASEYGFRSRSQ